jgi:hypothetical protein
MTKMTRMFHLLMAIVAVSTCAAVTGEAQTLLVKGGTLIDGTGGTPIKDSYIYIQDGLIRNVWSGNRGAPSLPADIKVIDATGKYLIPGLIDSHVHYNSYEGELFLHYGVTTIYDLGGGQWSESMKKGVEAGTIRAPRYFHHVSFGDGANGKSDSLAGKNTAKTRVAANVNSPADAESAVNAVAGKTDIITLNEDWKGDDFAAISKAAHAHGISIISHSYNALNTSDWGVDGIEHMTGVGMAAATSAEGKAAIEKMGICKHSYAPLLEQSLSCIAAGHKNSLLYRWMDTTYFPKMIDHLVKNNTFLNPTLDFEWGGIIDRSPQFELEDSKLLENPNLDYVPEDEKKEFLDQYHWADGRSPEERVEFMRGYKNVLLFLKKFVAAGGKLYSGTDTASANVPGLSLHHEMQIYTDAGIPAMQALLSSTEWAAEMARLDKKIGSVVAGKYGDVVILDADPLVDIHNAQKVNTVIKGGVVQDISFHQGYSTPFRIFGQGTKHLYALPPVVSNLAPSLVTEGDEVWVTVSGANFSPNSIALFDGKAVETKFVGDGELRAKFTSRQTAEAGNYQIGVFTPKPGGGTTEGLTIVVGYKWTAPTQSFPQSK